MSKLFLDFESVDKGLGKPGKSNAWMNYRRLGIGPGWATMNKDIFSVLGAAVTDDQGMEAHYLTNMDDLKTLVAKYDTIVMHNAQYDLGCLSFLGIDYEDKTILCTRIGAKLINNLEYANLDHLAKLYLKENKTGASLSDYAWESGLFAKIHKDLTGKTSARKPGVDTIKDFAYSHLDYIQDMNFKLVADYAIQDIVLTRRLHDLFTANLDPNVWALYSNLNKVLVANRIRGVNVDIEKAKFYSKIADKDLKDKIEALYELAGKSFNFNSTAQIAEVLAPRGLKFLTSASGKPSITSGWMKEQLDPICQGILAIKALRKRNDDFLKKIIHLADAAKGTKLYPSFNLLAADTGRMTSNEPNLQQIPKASKKDPSALSKSFRGIYVPSEGLQWYSMDFSAQEIRIALHYAVKLGLDGAAEVQQKYIENPLFDSHQYVAEITGLSRDEAKAVNLGLCLAGDTKVLTDSGWKDLVNVTVTDMVFDGEAFVEHKGVVFQGHKEVIWNHGLGATAEHEILTGDSWQDWQEVHTQPLLLKSALSLAKSKYLTFITEVLMNTVNELGIGLPKDNVTAEQLKSFIVAILANKNLQNAICATEEELKTSPKNDSRIGSTLSSPGALSRTVRAGRITEAEESQSPKSSSILKLFMSIYSRLMDTTTQSSTWTESTIVKAMSEEIYGFVVAKTTLTTDDQSENLKKKIPVYDIYSAGPNKRFTVLTDKGMMIVHNCYGMGTYKLCNSLGLINKVELEYLSGLAQRGERPNNKYKSLIERTKQIKNKYLQGAPYIEQLIEHATKVMDKRGYIISLGGRKIRTEPRKALNALIQGSAADQTMKAMADIHAAGLNFLFPVHDSIEHEGTMETALQIKTIMEEAYKLEIPVVADISGGSSWGDVVKIETTTKERTNA